MKVNISYFIFFNYSSFNFVVEQYEQCTHVLHFLIFTSFIMSKPQPFGTVKYFDIIDSELIWRHWFEWKHGFEHCHRLSPTHFVRGSAFSHPCIKFMSQNALSTKDQAVFTQKLQDFPKGWNIRKHEWLIAVKIFTH